jgi:phosphatidylserine/phosphatidylglycerophosphate/cardiolipin synthase-like enzyme
MIPGIVCLFLGASSWGQSYEARQSSLLITGVLMNGALQGSIAPDSAIRIENTLNKTLSLEGVQIAEDLVTQNSESSGSFSEGMDTMQIEQDYEEKEVDEDENNNTPSRNRDNSVKRADSPRKLSVRSLGRLRPRTIRFPLGATIPARGVIWIAATAQGFKKVFGYKPHYETLETDSQIPNMLAEEGFLWLPTEQGHVVLRDLGGAILDCVAYDASKEASYNVKQLEEAHCWKGSPVYIRRSSFYGWKGQILARDRDEDGNLLPDTQRAQDWDSGFSKKHLGEEPTHRIEIAGQSRFIIQPLKRSYTRVLATSAPDNNFQTLIAAIHDARKSIRVRLYEFTNMDIANALIEATKRGVKVWIFLEGSPVGGISDQSRYVMTKAAAAGIEVYFLGVAVKGEIKPRYRFDHSKYVIIDDKKAIIGTENYGRTGVPIDPSKGNRGWMVHVENPQLVKQLREVWDADFQPGVMHDVVSIHASSDDAYGMPYRDPSFVPDLQIKKGHYNRQVTPVDISANMDLELVLSPDTSLHENRGLIGMIQRAQKELIIEQNSIRRRWGSVKDTHDETPNLLLQAVVAAARRGVKVRVLLDSTWYNIQGDFDRDNDDTVLYLQQLAEREKLDLQAKVINLETAHLEKIHTKGIIVDGKEVFVGSINWTENSFKGNREVGVIIRHPRVTEYYQKLFESDWNESRMYQARPVQETVLYTEPHLKAAIVKKQSTQETLFIVSELYEKDTPKDTHRRRWVEVKLHNSRRAYIPFDLLAEPIVTPAEAIHVIGRSCFLRGRVTEARLTEKTIQLRFGDPQHPSVTVSIKRSLEQKLKTYGIQTEKDFVGHEVTIRGIMKQGRQPQMMVTHPEDILFTQSDSF